MSKFCRANCHFLSPTESEQDHVKANGYPIEKHVCLKYHTQVKHIGMHPLLHKCDQCLSGGWSDLLAKANSGRDISKQEVLRVKPDKRDRCELVAWLCNKGYALDQSSLNYVHHWSKQ